MAIALKQYATIGENGKLDLIADPPEGTKVEVMVQEPDETTYLLSKSADYNEAIRLKPDYAYGYYSHGLVKYDLGDS